MIRTSSIALARRFLEGDMTVPRPVAQSPGCPSIDEVDRDLHLAQLRQRKPVHRIDLTDHAE